MWRGWHSDLACWHRGHDSKSRRVKTLRLVLIPALLSLAACSGDELTRTFGLTRDAPDEFLVTTRAPLSMPDDLALPPPRPGATRPQELTQEQQAEAVLVPDILLAGADQTAPTSGEAAFVAAAGGPAPADIRERLEREAALDRPRVSLGDRLMFWQSPPMPGTVVDPVREKARLQQDAALGLSPEVGDTPIIQRQRQGLFSSLF
jgi:hypothetical protein